MAIDALPEELFAEEAPNRKIELVLEIDEVKEAINRLEPDQQSVIIMKFVEELSNKEIASAINKTEGAVRVIQHRALKKIKDILSEKENANS